MADEDTSSGQLSPQICRELEKNPGCPFVKQITSNAVEISWIKRVLKGKTVLDLSAYIGLFIAIAAVLLTIAGG